MVSGATTSRLKWWRSRTSQRRRNWWSDLLLGRPSAASRIVYTPTRKQADALAARLSRSVVPAAAYHAGLDAAHRKRVQEEFLAGKIEVMVATIAFGMGIDKPDVRTVIHTALPGSIEAYYQEIGRAGRDGKPSRAILMHSYADRYTHDFFFERDYPDVKILEGIYARLREDPQEKAALQKQLRVDPDIFDKALEKLWIHRGAVLDFAENASRGQPDWRDSYLAHGEQKRAQIELVIRFASSNQCRMAALVRHFGDLPDGRAALRDLRLLRSGGMCRPAFPPRDGSGACHGDAGDREPAFRGSPFDGEAARRNPPRREDDARRL